MNNIERLVQRISQVEGFIAATEEKIAAGEGWLDAQLVSLKCHLEDIQEQLSETIKQQKSNKGFVRNRPVRHRVTPTGTGR